MCVSPAHYAVIFVLMKAPTSHFLYAIIRSINPFHRRAGKLNTLHVGLLHRMSPITGPMISSGSANEVC